MAIRLLAALPAAVLALTRPAHAQLLEQYYPSGIPGYRDWFSDTVLDRPRTEYDSLGVHAGGFTIRPELSEAIGYNSNILGTTPGPASAFAETTGEMAAESNWSRDSLNAAIGFDNMRYVQQPALSYTNWNAALGGSLDIGRDRATLAYTHLTITTLPSTIGTLGLTTPVTYAVDEVRGTYQAEFGRLTVVPLIDLATYRFDNGPPGSGTGAESVNNRNTLTGTLTAGFELAQGRSLVLVGSGTVADYTTALPGLPTQNYNDISVLGGIDDHVAGPFRYRALFGYERRSSASPQIPGIDSPIVELDTIWTPSRLTTVTGRITRSIQTALTQTDVPYTFTDFHLSVDHEYLRNVLLNATADYQLADYAQNLGTQRLASFGVGASWLLNRQVRLALNYTYSRGFDPSSSLFNFVNNTVLLRLEFRP